jgi:curved DNA-binding protein CbpA
VSSSSRAQHVAHLAVLGLPASADREAVRQRYLQLVKIHHPDTSTDPDTVDKFRSGIEEFLKVFLVDNRDYLKVTEERDCILSFHPFRNEEGFLWRRRCTTLGVFGEYLQ